MTELHSEIEISATPEKVWGILTDFERYPEWNPFITQIEGEVKSGGRLELRIRSQAQSNRVLKARFARVEPLKELSWLSRSWIIGLFDRHISLLIDQVEAGQITFTQKHRLWGLLVPLSWIFISDDWLTGMEQMSVALKEAAEKE